MRDQRRKDELNDQQTAVLRNDRAAVLENRNGNFVLTPMQYMFDHVHIGARRDRLSQVCGSFCRFEDLDGNPFGLAGFNDVTRALEAQRKAEAQRREARRLAAQELDIAKQVQARLLPQRLATIPTLD